MSKQKLVKLNLGCGNKLYPEDEGWINVDAIELTTTPDNVKFVRSELHVLDWLEDNSVDEIHGIHIIEHFFRDEVPEVLKEWNRVLKKGGILILEQPDVVKCAANFLAGLVNGNEKLEYNLGFLGFYGDGTSKEPLMGHKWGWYPATLGEVLTERGFINVRQEPAKMHMKDVRDFRIIGEKS